MEAKMRNWEEGKENLSKAIRMHNLYVHHYAMGLMPRAALRHCLECALELLSEGLQNIGTIRSYSIN